MRKQQSKPITRLLHSRVLFGTSVILCAALFFQLIKVVQKSTTTDREIALLAEESAKLSEEYTRLDRLTTVLESDYFAEREARTKLGYKKPGENAVIIIAQEQSDGTTVAHKGPSRSSGERSSRATREDTFSDEEPERNALRWWRYFFGF